MTETPKPRRPWTISPEKRLKLEAALTVLLEDHCDYLAGRKPRREYPALTSAHR